MVITSRKPAALKCENTEPGLCSLLLVPTHPAIMREKHGFLDLQNKAYGIFRGARDRASPNPPAEAVSISWQAASIVEVT